MALQARPLWHPAGMTPWIERFNDRPEALVPLVLHKLGHVQQSLVQGPEAFQRAADDPNTTLLARALREGTADLIAALATGWHINPLADRSPYDSILLVGCRGGGLFATDLGTVQKDVSPDVSRGFPW